MADALAVLIVVLLLFQAFMLAGIIFEKLRE